MSFAGYRALMVLCLIVLLGLHPAANAAGSPSERQIAQWIKELGDSDFAVREKASRQLFLAGEAAEAALEKALRSSDPEVVRRARDILAKFRWGIYGDTPAEIVALIQRYKDLDTERQEIVDRLFHGGPMGVRAVLKIARAEKDQRQRYALARRICKRLPDLFRQALTENNYETFERFLEFVYEDQFFASTQYAAYWLLRGKLEERIAYFRARLKRHPDDRHCTETLAYLYRAKGDLSQACKMAERSGREDLIEGILFEAADWKALAARPAASDKDGGGDRLVIRDLDALAFRAAYARLAGDTKQFEKIMSQLREESTKEKPDYSSLAPAFFLNDRPADGLAQYLKSDPPNAFEILWARLQYREALELANRLAAGEDKEPQEMNVLKARALYQLGETDKAKEIFKRLAARIKDGVDRTWVISLLKEEHRLGLEEEAFDHYGRLLNVLTKEDKQKIESWKISTLATFYPQRREIAETWWHILSGQFSDAPATLVLKRLREVMDGKVAAEKIQTWIEEADRRLSHPDTKTPAPDAAQQRLTMAEIAVSSGRDELAAMLLEKADTPQALIQLGDRLAKKKEWTTAAERYRQAWRKNCLSAKDTPSDARSVSPLPLFLAGHALMQAGRPKEGRALMEQAHLAPLDDMLARDNFREALAQRGHKEDARRELDLMLRVGELNSFHSISVRYQLAREAAARKEYAQAADGFEQEMLSCLPRPRIRTDRDDRTDTDASFDRDFTFTWTAITVTPISAYLEMPAHIHQMRAAALVAAGKIEEARKQIDLALAASPGNIEVPGLLVPQLERHGRKAEAETLFERCYRTYARLCREYPRCALAHNGAAWLSACCRRNLDAALQHAQKAVALEPANARYLDTLAEVHFQRGDREKAVAAEKRAIELDPKRAYFRKQLKRMEAGDPSAERPPEIED